jgi:hypothetical protein
VGGDCCAADCRFERANSPCDDKDVGTCEDVCSGTGICSGIAQGPCVSGDGCCPTGCSASTDLECEQVNYGNKTMQKETNEGGPGGGGDMNKSNNNNTGEGGGAGGATTNAIDLVLGDGASEEVVVLEGDGQGNFTRAGSSNGAAAGSGGSVADLALADVNADGNLDVVTALSSGELSTLLGDGNLGIAQGPHSALVAAPLRVELTELNADARPDAVVATDAGAELLRNTGSGAFTRLTLLDTGSPVSDVAVARPAPRIVVALPESDQVKVYRQPGETAEMVETVEVEEPRAVAAADFTGDGVEDLAVASGQGFVAVFPGRAEGGFAAALKERVNGVTLRRLWRADLNGNGHADLVGLEQNEPALQLLLGRGDGTFELQAGPAGTQAAAGVVVADLNGDRLPDLVLSGEEITVGVAELAGPAIVAGDASGDGLLTPADVDQLISEIFDGDGDAALSCGAPPIMSFAGADANADGLIGAADLTSARP